jgi:hypothetical protein
LHRKEGVYSLLGKVQSIAILIVEFRLGSGMQKEWMSVEGLQN